MKNKPKAKTRPAQRELTMRQEEWCQTAVETLNPTEAARRTYNIGGKGGKMTTGTEGSIASENLHKPYLRERILQLLKQQGYSVNKHTQLIAEGAQAQKRDQFSGEIYPDWQNRHKFIDMVNKLADVYPAQKVAKTSLTGKLSDLILKGSEERKIKTKPIVSKAE